MQCSDYIHHTDQRYISYVGTIFIWLCHPFDVLFFFFQAEDGIRDDLVTGVQTCALPILNASGISRRLIAFASSLFGWMRGGLAHVSIGASMFFAEISGSAVADIAALGSILIPAMKSRSEERRVGKECRSRWERDRSTKTV